MKNSDTRYSISLSFREISLPPIEDILILGKTSVQGKNGLAKSFEYLVPDTFTTVDIEHENVEAIFINKRILSKISVEKIKKVLFERVFPFTSPNELVKVDFKVVVSYDTIEVD